MTKQNLQITKEHEEILENLKKILGVQRICIVGCSEDFSHSINIRTGMDALQATTLLRVEAERVQNSWLETTPLPLKR